MLRHGKACQIGIAQLDRVEHRLSLELPMRRFAWIVTLPIIAIVTIFAVMNRQDMALNLWPLPWDFSLPVFLFTLLLILFGFCFGVLVMRQRGTTHRRAL